MNTNMNIKASQDKKKAINRLKLMRPLRAKVDESYQKSIEAMKAGKPTAWSMVNWWEGDPILKAMDLAVVYPENFGTVCAASGVARKYLDRSDKEGFPSHMCGYARNCIGYTATMMKDFKGEIPPNVPLGGMPKPALLVSSGIICDARYKWFQSLVRYIDVPQFVLEMPHPGVEELFLEDTYKNIISFMIEELKEFITFLEQLLGKKMDWDKLDETVNHMIEICRVWYEANELRKAQPCPMHSRDFWSAMPPALFLMGDLEDSLKCYRDVYNEIKHRVDNNIGAVDEEKYRLAFAELPPWHSLNFFDKLAERGWNFVIESWNYHPPVPLDLDGVSDPLERIAKLSFQWFTGRFEAALESKEYLGYLSYPYFEYIKEYKCDGTFLHPLLTCRSATSHLAYTQHMLMQKLKVPSMMIEGDIVDLRMFNPVDALNKVDAFEETMEYYRGVREKEGFDW